MKNFIKLIAVTGTVVLIGSAFSPKNDDVKPVLTQDKEDGIEIKGAVKDIIENKCMSCHNPEARNEKGKKKLQWVNVSKLDKEGQEHLIAELLEVLEDGKMPPKRTVERKPEMKLTDEETKTLLTWVEKEDNRLYNLDYDVLMQQNYGLQDLDEITVAYQDRRLENIISIEELINVPVEVNQMEIV